MKKVSFFVLVFLLAFLSVPGISQYTPTRPPTQCEDACLREFSRQADGHVASYRSALTSIAYQAFGTAVTAWVSFFDAGGFTTTGGAANPTWGTVVTPLLALFQNNVYQDAIFQADLSYYSNIQNDMNGLNLCLGQCPAPSL
ncbi:hypothetical protein [Dyadobacter sp. OTU695]|uniref:hypothetical protein n=1 Tax=Dyadobacter sp. OTU695 TaxID=3043860 RepID=UPI00313BFF3E